MKMANIADLKSAGETLEGSIPSGPITPRVIRKEIIISRVWEYSCGKQEYIKLVQLIMDLAHEYGYKKVSSFPCLSMDATVFFLEK